MKKFFLVFLCVSIFTNTTPLYASNYKFESGADNKIIFGKSTSSDEIVPVNSQTTNVRRNKDASYFPPAYGIFSGEIPTDQSSLYHSNNTASYGSNSTAHYNSGGTNANSTYTSVNSPVLNTVIPEITVSETASVSSYISETTTLNTNPWKYDDGSIGMLHIPKISKTLKVYEGESLENMRKGIGHFESTSAWDGNVGFAAVRPDRALLNIV